MKIAIVTPYGPKTDTDHWLRCHASVIQQEHPAEHWVVFDGCQPVWDTGIQAVPLPRNCGNFGDVPRAIGSLAAFGAGMDAVCWLDADNWLLPNHVQRMVREHHQTGMPIITSGRMVVDYLCRYKPEPCVEQGRTLFWDTGSYFATKEVAGFVSAWAQLEPEQHIVGDRVLGLVAKQADLVASHDDPTYVYRSRLKFHYDQYGWDPTGVELEVK